MSDGINDAEGRRTDYDKFRAKYKGRWGVWDSGYFYPDTPKKRKEKTMARKAKRSLKATRVLQLKEAAAKFVSDVGDTDQRYDKITDQDYANLITLLNRTYRLGVRDGKKA